MCTLTCICVHSSSYVNTSLFASTALFICKYGSFHSCVRLFSLCKRLFSDAYTALFIVYTALFRCVYSFVDLKIRLFCSVCALLFGSKNPISLQKSPASPPKSPISLQKSPTSLLRAEKEACRNADLFGCVYGSFYRQIRHISNFTSQFMLAQVFNVHTTLFIYIWGGYGQ